MQQCIKIVFYIYMKLNMFRATHLPSVGVKQPGHEPVPPLPHMPSLGVTRIAQREFTKLPSVKVGRC
jgi:hypothetical protein